MSDPAELIRSAPLGTRMTVRKRIDGGFTDAVGYLRELTDSDCIVETRHGMVAIRLDDVAAAKAVPPPPQRRTPRSLPTASGGDGLARGTARDSPSDHPS
jgi:hypothetical protein